MSAGLLHLSLFLSLLATPCVYLAAADDLLEVSSALGADFTLPCTAAPRPGVQYRAVRWYKVGEPPSDHLSGILTRDLPNGVTRWYTGVEREVELRVESRGIFLPNVTCADGGVYLCHLAAPVGEQNQEGKVLLTLTDCPDSLMEKLLKDAYVLIATSVLMVALVIFCISFVCLKNILRDKSKTTKKETLLDAPLRPLEKKDLMLIYTLGPKLPKTPAMKHVCV